MIIVDYNAEEKLIEHLESIGKSKLVRRCIHLRLSPTEEYIPEAVIQSVSVFFSDEDITVYQCSPDTFYIIGETLMTKECRVFQTALTRYAPEFNLYDLSVHWRDVIALAEKAVAGRREAEDAARKETERQQAEARRQSILATPVDQAQVASIQERRSSRAQMEIMIVEDDAFSRSLLTGALDKDFGVIFAEGGVSAIQGYVRKAPDIVFLDIDLPDVTGHDILKKILFYDPSAFVIMLSGHGSRDNILKAIEAGARGFVGKPFTKDKLMQYILKCPSFRKSGESK